MKQESSFEQCINEENNNNKNIDELEKQEQKLNEITENNIINNNEISKENEIESSEPENNLKEKGDIKQYSEEIYENKKEINSKNQHNE